MKLSTIDWIYIILGLLALVDVLWSAVHHRLSLNLAVLLIPVGIGLLQKKESSFKWAIVWSCILISASLIGLIITLFAKDPRITDTNRIIALALALISTVLFIIINRRLTFISSQTGIYVFSNRNK